jgi:hypothetical protein
MGVKSRHQQLRRKKIEEIIFFKEDSNFFFEEYTLTHFVVKIKTECYEQVLVKQKSKKIGKKLCDFSCSKKLIFYNVKNWNETLFLFLFSFCVCVCMCVCACV